MKQNYSKHFSLFLLSIFLVLFVFTGFSGFSQSITKPILDKSEICRNSSIMLDFTLISDPGNGNRFNDFSNFSIKFISQEGLATVSKNIEMGATPGNNSSMQKSLMVNTTDFNLSDGTYKLSLHSTDPTTNSPESEIFTIVTPPVYTESQSGNNSWIGHVYDGTNQNTAFTQNFTNYIGGYTEALSFDQNFGGDQNDFRLGVGTCNPSINTETFSIRYRMKSSLTGLYALNIGADDGSRLSIDGQLVYNDWNDHAYRNSNVLLNLTGNNNLVLDYYENVGGNRISTGAPQLLIKNVLSTNINQTINPQNPLPISGDIFQSLPTGISQDGSGYQWVYSTSNGGATTSILGATQATFIPNTNAAPFNSSGTYYIYRIARLNGTSTGQNYTAISKSNAATVVVKDAININSQPQNITSCTGTSIYFTVNASGQNLSYQWQRNNGGNNEFYNISNGGAFSGTKESNLVINPAEFYLNNIRFRVIISNDKGNSVTSNSAVLNLNQSPQGVNTQPTNQIVCAGNNISFQTYTSNDNRQWQVSIDNGSSWNDLSNNQFYQNVTSEKLDIINAPLSFNNNLYRIKVYNQTCSVFSTTASLKVNPDPITQQPQNVTAAFGNNAIIEAQVSGNNLSFQWQTFSSNWYNLEENIDNYNGTKTKRLELITVGYFPVDGSRYRLLVTNENGCVSISNTAILNVGDNQCPEPPNVEITAPTLICAGQVNITGTLTGTAPWNIQARVNGQIFNLNIGERNFSYPLDIQQNTTIEIIKITDANTCENNTPNKSFTINVINSINNNTISGAQESCGILEASILTGEDLGQGYNYLWQVSTTNATSGFTVAPGINNEANYNPGTISETSFFRRVVEVQNCSSTISNVLEISINSNIENNNISFFNGNSGTITATANENENINLSAPEGTVFTYVNFASYGTPNNNNGSSTINENCHAQPTQSITESYLLGRKMAIIPASNNVFSDPCAGTFKRLVVEATYSEAFCTGVNPGTVSGSLIVGNNIAYSWRLSTEGPSSGFADAPGNNNLQNYTPSSLNESTWLKRIVTSGSCSSESPVLYIPVKEVNTWTGAQDTNWNNTNNWSCKSLPTLETDVLIPENLASGNYPEINNGNEALTKNLTIENSARVQVTNNWLEIAGALLNEGILNTGAGSVSFEGALAQVIPTSAFKDNRIQNLKINNAAGVISEANIEVTGILKVEVGFLDTGNELTLISNETQTALIDGSGNGEIVGLVSMQRYLDRAFGYKYFSSPFQNSVVGDFLPYMDFEDPISKFPNFYRYNENRNININNTIRDASGWEVYTNASNSLNKAEGYALNFGSSNDAQTIEIIGEVNNGVIAAKPLENNHREFTRGFHLVGNPYPSPIDWNAAQGWTRNNIDDGIYFFTASDTNQYTGTYTAYVNNISTGDALVDSRSSNIIPSMQGFFIKVSDSETQDLVTGSFGMNNKVRITNFTQEFLRTQISEQKSIIRLEAGFKDVKKKDPMVIYFSPFSTSNFEKEMDAHKLMNTDPDVPSFYNVTKTKKELAINAIPFPESKSYNKILLGLKADKTGKMNINLASVENLSPNFNVYLIDHEKTIGQNLRDKPEYVFNIEAGTHNSRFELMFSEEEITSPAIAFNQPFEVEVENGNVVIVLNLEDKQVGVLSASTITGQILQTRTGSGKERVIIDGITSNGVYIINLQVGEEQHAKKILINK